MFGDSLPLLDYRAPFESWGVTMWHWLISHHLKLYRGLKITCVSGIDTCWHFRLGFVLWYGHVLKIITVRSRKSPVCWTLLCLTWLRHRGCGNPTSVWCQSESVLSAQKHNRVGTVGYHSPGTVTPHWSPLFSGLDNLEHMEAKVIRFLYSRKCKGTVYSLTFSVCFLVTWNTGLTADARLGIYIKWNVILQL